MKSTYISLWLFGVAQLACSNPAPRQVEFVEKLCLSRWWHSEEKGESVAVRIWVDGTRTVAPMLPDGGFGALRRDRGTFTSIGGVLEWHFDGERHSYLCRSTSSLPIEDGVEVAPVEDEATRTTLKALDRR